MRKSKKVIFGALTAAAVVAVPTLSVISCGRTTPGNVFFVSDGGSIHDQSFNQLGAESVAAILNKEKLDSSDYNEPKSGDSAALSQGYEAALNARKEIVVATGFYHEQAVIRFLKDLGKVLKFILADVSGENPKFQNSVAGVQYKTKESGFLAGYYSSQFLVEVKKDKTPIVGTFGGAKFPGVTDFMVGFINGVKNYNDTAKPQIPVKFATFGNEKDYLNSGFESGGGKSKATKLLSEGADVILPVAGPQTADVISVLKGKKGKYVIGVDTDQKLRYPNDQELFLTSIVKNIKESIVAVYNKVSGIKSEPWAKGYGGTTWGTLSNGLTGISSPSNAVLETEAQNKEAQKVYENITTNKKLMETAAATAKTTTWDSAYKELVKLKK